jgi:hypothetical protein
MLKCLGTDSNILKLPSGRHLKQINFRECLPLCLFCGLLYKNVKKMYTIIIVGLPVVLYFRENWSVTLREEYRLKALQNSVATRMY